jgi:CRISPR-associated endonuclease/helicase Cas3
MSELLAKSPYGERQISLERHTIDVMDAAECLFGTPSGPTRLGQAWLRFFRISAEYWPMFQVNLLASAAFHDWGKANSSFQAVVHGHTGEQIIRHEHLSALLLALEPVTKWLTKRPEIDVDVVLSAVLTHHLKATHDPSKRHCLAARPPGVRTMRIHDDSSEFAQLTHVTAERLGLDTLALPLTGEQRSWSFRDDRNGLRKGTFDLEGHRDKVKIHRLRPLEVSLRSNEIRRRLLWAVRAGLIAADAAGSGLPRVGQDMRPWMEAAFHPAKVCTEVFIFKEIIGKRVEELVSKGKWSNWSPFQDACADARRLPDRGLLLAPCGSGKTLAAWRWIAARLKDKPAGRVLFLYPTRATAKEGFRDYVSWAPEADAALMHGTAAYDLDGMFANPDDPRHESRYEVDRRLFSLGFWTRRVFSATVDQFLAFMQYSYGAMCMLPVLADAVVVIDEVHSFDHAMFTALKSFLQTFDVPVLCLTASLPNERCRELEQECQLTKYDEKPGELHTIATAQRYRLRRMSIGEARGRVHRALTEGRRILWVVNQVKRAQREGVRMASDFCADACQERLRAGGTIPLLCYHSRFRLDDRVRRHNEVVEAFREGCPAALAISTQVCEMSLDMDADILVTEDCPITSLIQRMGRCNRARMPRSLDHSGEVLIYRPEKPEPYDEAAMTGLEKFLDTLCRRDSVSQADLEAALQDAPPPPPLGDRACGFLSSGPYALAGEQDFRDIDEFNQPAVLKGEVAAFLGADKALQPGFVVPVPHRLARERDAQNRLPAYLHVADDRHYHKALGFCDRPITDMKGAD